MRYVSDVESFYDFIGYVVLCAPDKFPARDYLPVDEQMNIEMAFVELKRGLRIIYSEVADEEKRVRLESLLDQAVHAYSKGDDLCGAHLLQDFQDLIFKRN
ncbi:hypothetical protein PCO31111_04621 [Pandoraea communis]|uniref:Uncharacterized protein n=1 Tax=Pandoraea communis TaxID=2508297 RepID=A0A5E4YL10_9BURK|nr:hypothetical protein PCO31111_04621 [Pandoraea communis]